MGILYATSRHGLRDCFRHRNAAYELPPSDAPTLGRHQQSVLAATRMRSHIKTVLALRSIIQLRPLTSLPNSFSNPPIHPKYDQRSSQGGRSRSIAERRPPNPPPRCRVSSTTPLKPDLLLQLITIPSPPYSAVADVAVVASSNRTRKLRHVKAAATFLLQCNTFPYRRTFLIVLSARRLLRGLSRRGDGGDLG